MKKQQMALVSRVTGYASSMRDHRSFSLGGQPATRRNLDIISRCLEAWLFLIEDLMIRQQLHEVARRVRMDNFVQAFLRADFIELLLFLEGVYTVLIKDSCESADAFKQHLFDSPSSVDWSRLLSPIDLYLYSFLGETDKERKAYFLSSIAQFLRFPRKLELEAIGLEAQALQGYEETEKELESVCLGECPDLLNSLSDIIRDWCSGFHIENLRPMHGSGSVAEGSLTLAEKFGECKYDRRLQVLLSNPSFPNSYTEYFPVKPAAGLVRTSRTIFVPKTATKLRTISMEPATLQYIQQGVMYELYKFFRLHPYLGMRINLEDQTQNQVYAMEGSKYHTYGTLDLSHASDSVSWDLVRNVFKSVPRLYRWLQATRSNKTLLPDGRTITLRKFAPMGSALCFPVQCLLFAAVIEHASRRACAHSSGGSPLWSVYGDDLIVPSHIYGDVVRCLQLLGFTVNVEKSYNDGEYRESCGKEYYHGVDITPIYYRIPYNSKRVTPSVYGSWCSSANNAALHGLPVYRAYLVGLILDAKRKFGPYFTYSPEASPMLYSSQPTNFHVRKRWNSKLQRWEGKFCVVKCKQRASELDDESLRYFVKLVEMSKRGSNHAPHLDESVAPVSLHGCVEFFSSTVLPCADWYRVDKTLTSDWWDT